MAGEYAVLGLGQFGRAVAKSLARNGQSVLVADRNLEMVQNEVDAAVGADLTDEDALYELELETMSCVIVAIGGHSTEASIMTTALLAQMGVPRIVARSSSELHSRILRSVGAHEVVNPEGEMGERLARRLYQPNIVDQLELGEATLAEVAAPQSLTGQTLSELDLRNRYQVSVIAIQRGGSIQPNPRANDTIRDGDILVLMGASEAIDQIAALS